MSDPQNQPAFSIEKVYVKDISLEIPNAPQIFLERETPQVDIQLHHESQPVEDGVFFAGIDDCRFKRVVEPGDVLTLTCEIDTVRGPIGRGKATAHVGDALAARGTLTFAVER